MLKILRKKGVAKRLLWIVAVVIILSFGFFGQSYLLRNRGNVSIAGKIFGRNVSFKNFEAQYVRTYIQSYMQYGENFDKIRDHLNLDSQTWDRLILLHEAKKRRIKITDDEVINTIQSYKFFQKDGVFNQELYERILHYVLKIRPRDFEESIRDSQKFAKIFEQETSTVTLGDQEVFSEYKKQNEQIQVSYVLFSADNYTQEVSPSAEQLAQYYQSHKNEFRVPPAINIEYIALPLSEEANPEEKESVSEKIAEIHKKAIKNGTLESVSKEYNLPIESSGFFTMEQPFLKIGWSFKTLKNIFDLEVNQISEPINTARGSYIVTLKEKRADYIPKCIEVQEKVQEKVAVVEAKKIAQQKAEEFSRNLKNIYAQTKRPEFNKIIADQGLEASQTPLFSRGQYLPEIGLAKNFQDAAFSLSDTNKISDAVEIQKGYCVLHLESFTPIDPDTYEKEQPEFYEKLLAEKKNEAFNDFLAQLKLEANLVDNIAEIKEASQQQ